MNLPPRQQEVLALMAEGLSNREIASRMAVTEKTVRVYAEMIYRHLHLCWRPDVNHRVAAVLAYLDERH